MLSTWPYDSSVLFSENRLIYCNDLFKLYIIHWASFILLTKNICRITWVKKWSKLWIQKSPSKSNVIYPKTTTKNTFRSGGQKLASHMEAKVAKMPIESFSVLGLQSLKMYLFTINLLFRSILIALKRGLFPIYHIRLEKSVFKNLIIT